MSRTRLRVNPHSIVVLIQGTPCLKQAQNLKFTWLQRDSNTQPLVRKRTLNHLVKLTNWLSCVVSTYLYGAFYCVFLSCHVCVSECNHTLKLPECQGTPCPKQVQYLKFKWLQWDSNPQTLSSQTNAQPLSQTGQVIEIGCQVIGC